MRILMVAPQPFFTPRGTPFSVLYRLRALSSLGHQVDLATYPMGADPEIPGVTIYRPPAVPGIEAVRVGPSPAKILLDALLLLKVLWLAMVNRYDLIHTHEEAGLMGALLSRLTSVPHIYDMHSSLPQQFGNFNAYNVSPVVAVFKAVEAAILAGADGVITICPDLARHVQASRFPRPHRLIENTFTDEPDRTAVRREAEILRERHGLAGRRVILYTGTLEAYQGLPLLVEAAVLLKRRMRDLLFVIVGGEEAQVRSLQATIHGRGLRDDFLLTGQLPPECIPAWLSLAELLVSPRIAGTNTPLKIYQYLKSGVPLVATGIHSHSQILDDSIAVLVPPTAEGLAGGLAGLLDQPAAAARLSAAARNRARRKYSNEAYVRKMAELLETVTGGAPGRKLGLET